MNTITKPAYDLAIQSPSLRRIAYVSVIADKIEDRQQFTLTAANEEELIAKLATDYHLHPCPVKPDVFRTSSECDRIRMERKTPMDKTEYARAIGYTGAKPVMVQDGKVISHRYKDWFDFCAILHDAKRIRQSRLNSDNPSA